MGKEKRKMTGEAMLSFAIVLREWWKGLNKTERRLMMETVFSPPARRADPRARRRAQRDLLEAL